MVAKRLTQRVSRHPVAKSKVSRNTFSMVSTDARWIGLLGLAPVVGLTAEHAIAESNTRGILKVQGNRFDYGRVDGDVAVTTTSSCVLGLLLQNGESVSERAVIVDDVGKAK